MFYRFNTSVLDVIAHGPRYPSQRPLPLRKHPRILIRFAPLLVWCHALKVSILGCLHVNNGMALLIGGPATWTQSLVNTSSNCSHLRSLIPLCPTHYIFSSSSSHFLLSIPAKIQSIFMHILSTSTHRNRPIASTQSLVMGPNSCSSRHLLARQPITNFGLWSHGHHGLLILYLPLLWLINHDGWAVCIHQVLLVLLRGIPIWRHTILSLLPSIAFLLIWDLILLGTFPFLNIWKVFLAALLSRICISIT